MFDGPLWSDMSRILWATAEEIAKREGLTTVEIIYEGKVYTYTRLEGPHGAIEWYGLLTKK